jgi:AAA domain/UvrD-like helicase C-terminal domain
MTTLTTSAVARLIAPAGTGKSFVQSAVGEELAERRLLNTVLWCAPTHRACREAEAKFKASPKLRYIRFETLARTLCLNESIDSNGKQRFEQYREPELDLRIACIVIDESSMVGAYLVRCLKELMASHTIKRRMAGLSPLKILLVGDERQLTPVGESLNEFFTDPTLPTFRLTAVVRHAGPVLEQATRSRAMPVGRPVYNTVGDGSEVWATTFRGRFERRFVEALKAAQLDGTEDDVVALASTNWRVDELCALGRRALYGDNAPEYVPGEMLITCDMVKRNVGGVTMNLAPSTTRIRLSEVEQIMMRPVSALPPWGWKGDAIPMWKLTGVLVDDPDQTLITFNRVCAGYVDVFKAELDDMAAEIKALPERARTEVWREVFYPLKAMHAKVRSAVALTIHRSQGSSIPHVFVDMTNIELTCGTGTEALNRAAYTAVSRASKSLSLCDFRATEA